jgi:hypothetical protein
MAKREGSVVVRRPAHVPVELLHIWKAAARVASSQKKILTASGKVNYLEINKLYRNMLQAHTHAATLEGRRASTSVKNEMSQRIGGKTATTINIEYVQSIVAKVLGVLKNNMLRPDPNQLGQCYKMLSTLNDFLPTIRNNYEAYKAKAGKT